MKNIQSSILLKQVKIVNESLKLTMVSTILVGSVLFLQVYKELDTTVLWIWFAVFFASLATRIFLLIKKKNHPPNRDNIQKWVSLNFLNTILSSLAYGIIAGSTYFLSDQVTITIIYIIMAGVTAGAVTIYGPIKHLSIVFILPIIIPLTVANFAYNDISHMTLASITLFFCFIIYRSSDNLYKTFLNTFKQNITIRDLTEEKVRMEEMAKLKSDFFASMSHEIRTPLNGIIGLVDLLIKSKINNHQRDCLNTIKGSSDDLMKVINDVLDLSKIESEKLDLLPSKTSLYEFCRRMIILFSERAKSKGLEINLVFGNDLPNYVMVDEHRLSQITSNLISNAVKFTDSGSITLSVNCLSSSENMAKLQFKVEDTGIGIPEDKQTIIFNKYDQIAQANNYLITQTGTGLGLSIAKKLVALMNGEIGVLSKEKFGSIFWFTIDLPVLHNNKTAEREIQKFPENNFNFNVLLVDDRDINLKVASLMLNNLGCNVETASNGESAIEKYDASPSKFDLIIMDIQMPVMDGITATQKLRKKYEDNLAPIYGLSAQVIQNLHKTPEEIGFDYYLTKPLNLDELKNSLLRLS